MCLVIQGKDVVCLISNIKCNFNLGVIRICMFEIQKKFSFKFGFFPEESVRFKVFANVSLNSVVYTFFRNFSETLINFAKYDKLV